MKGHISLNINDTSVHFCNLLDEEYAVALLDSPTSFKSAGRLVAHDTVEHTLIQRQIDHVTVTNEIRALGAAMFVRPDTNPMWDLIYCVEHCTDWDLQQLPPKSTDLMDDYWQMVCGEMGEDIIYGKRRWFLHNMNFGYFRKAQQFNWCWYEANDAFHFIERMVNEELHLLDQEHWETGATGVSIYFDTNKSIWRTRYKRQ